MNFDWWTLGLQTVNFAVLVWLLHRLLYKPVLRIIDARRAEMEKLYAEANAAAAAGKEHLVAIEAERANLAAEREVTLKAAISQAEEAATKRRVEAEREAAALLENAEKKLTDERNQALAEARALAIELGADVARRLLAQAPAAVCGEGWLERIERHISSLSQSEKNSLVQQLSQGGALTVATASPLTPANADTWRRRIREALGAQTLTVNFETNASLIGGAELHFPAAVLRYSLDDALAAARWELSAS